MDDATFTSLNFAIKAAVLFLGGCLFVVLFYFEWPCISSHI